MESDDERTYLWGALRHALARDARRRRRGAITPSSSGTSRAPTTEARVFARVLGVVRARCASARAERGASFARLLLLGPGRGRRDEPRGRPPARATDRRASDLDEFRTTRPAQWIDLHEQRQAQIQTEGPLGLKMLARAAGFDWRDDNPSGEASMALVRGGPRGRRRRRTGADATPRVQRGRLSRHAGPARLAQRSRARPGAPRRPPVAPSRSLASTGGPALDVDAAEAVRPRARPRSSGPLGLLGRSAWPWSARWPWRDLARARGSRGDLARWPLVVAARWLVARPGSTPGARARARAVRAQWRARLVGRPAVPATPTANGRRGDLALAIEYAARRARPRRP